MTELQGKKVPAQCLSLHLELSIITLIQIRWREIYLGLLSSSLRWLCPASQGVAGLCQSWVKIKSAVILCKERAQRFRCQTRNQGTSQVLLFASLERLALCSGPAWHLAQSKALNLLMPPAPPVDLPHVQGQLTRPVLSTSCLETNPEKVKLLIFR